MIGKQLRVWAYGCLSNLSIVLLPVLALQGRSVRRSVPILPEAAGARSGLVIAGGQPFHILLLGDSTAAGVGVDSHTTGLIGQTAEHFAGLSSRTVNWQVIGKSGVRLHEVPQQLQHVAHGISMDAVMIAIGVNDVLKWTSGRSWRRNLFTLQSNLLNRFNDCLVIYSGLPPMADFPALPFPLNRVLAWRAKYLDGLLELWCMHHPQAVYLHVPHSAASSMLAEDGFHPSAKGYLLWAKSAANGLYKNLA